MKKYIAVLEIEDDEEIIDAKVTYFYSSNGMNYKATEKMELKEESEDAKNKTYEEGLNEAWELARKIVCRETDGGNTIKWVEDTFGSVRTDIVLRNFSASEAIEQVKKNEDIEVGDEVVDKNEWGVKGVVTKIDERSISIVEKEGWVSRYEKDEFNKTGRHFPQIEELLKQMKENE